MQVLFFSMLVDLIGFGMITPTLPFLAGALGATPDMIALLLSVYSLAMLIAVPFWGRLSDRIGRKPVIILSFAGSGASYLLLAFADTVFLLFVSRTIAGVFACAMAVGYASVSDATSEETRTRGMGYLAAAFGMALILGPMIGGTLATEHNGQFDFRTPTLAAAGFSFAAVLICFFGFRETWSGALHRRKAFASTRSSGYLIKYMFAAPAFAVANAMILFATFGFAAVDPSFALWAERELRWGPTEVGYMFAYGAGLAVLLQVGALGWLSRKFNDGTLALQSAVALGAGLFLIPHSTDLPTLFGAIALVSYGFGIGDPTLHSIVSKVAPRELKGSALGIAQSASSLGRVFGPMWAGFLFTAYGREWPFVSGALVMVVVMLLACTLVYLRRREGHRLTQSR